MKPDQKNEKTQASILPEDLTAQILGGTGNGEPVCPICGGKLRAVKPSVPVTQEAFCDACYRAFLFDP